MKWYAFGWYSMFLGFLVVGVDRLTKSLAWAYTNIPYEVNSFLSYHVIFNRGISWGLLQPRTHTEFVLVSSLIGSVLLGVLVQAAYHTHQRMVFGYSLIIAGAVSNLIDRVLYGGVLDFIVCSVGSYVWPAFNLADVSILLGVFILSIIGIYEYQNA